MQYMIRHALLVTVVFVSLGPASASSVLDRLGFGLPDTGIPEQDAVIANARCIAECGLDRAQCIYDLDMLKRPDFHGGLFLCSIRGGMCMDGCDDKLFATLGAIR